jgi:hypothetical protein
MNLALNKISAMEGIVRQVMYIYMIISYAMCTSKRPEPVKKRPQIGAELDGQHHKHVCTTSSWKYAWLLRSACTAHGQMNQ